MNYLNRRYTTLCVIAFIVIMISVPLPFSSIAADEPPMGIDMPFITRFKNDMTYAFMLSWDDGDEVNDVPVSLIEDKYEAKHTSFLVTSRITDDNIAQWMSMLFRGHDMEVHGRYHTAIGLNVNESSIRDVVEGGAADLKAWLGYNPIVFAYPFGSVSENASDIVLETFDFARGTKEEGFSTLGTWPITNKRDVKHSIGGLTGLQNTYNIPNIPQLYERFLTMIERDGRGYDTYGAFKTYGHTGQYYLNLEGRELFDMELAKLSQRNDTWFTSWGEAWAYEQVRTNTTIHGFNADSTIVSFFVTPELDIERYPVEITIRSEIPATWNIPLVEIDG